MVGDLERQLDLMEHQCRSLNQDKEQLEEELHCKQAALHQAASDAQHAQALAAQAAQATHERWVNPLYPAEFSRARDACFLVIKSNPSSAYQQVKVIQ